MRWNLTHMFKFRSLFTPFLLLLVLFTPALSYADDNAAPAQQDAHSEHQ